MADKRGKGRRGGRRSRRSEPLDIHLTVSLKFGEAPDDTLTMINDRRVPMAGSLLENRDRILRGFSKLLLRAAAMQPRLALELLHLRSRFGVLRRKRK